MNGEKFGGGNNPEAGKNNEQDRQQFQQAGEKTLDVINGEAGAGDNEITSADEPVLGGQDVDRPDTGTDIGADANTDAEKALQDGRRKTATEMMKANWEDISAVGIKLVSDFVAPYEDLIEAYNNESNAGLKSLDPSDLNLIEVMRGFLKEVADEMAMSDEEITVEALTEAFGGKVQKYLSKPIPAITELEAKFDQLDGGKLRAEIESGQVEPEAKRLSPEDVAVEVKLTPEEMEQVINYINTEHRRFAETFGDAAMADATDDFARRLLAGIDSDISSQRTEGLSEKEVRELFIEDLMNKIDQHFEQAYRDRVVDMEYVPNPNSKELTGEEKTELWNYMKDLADVWGKDVLQMVGNMQDIYEDVVRNADINGDLNDREALLELMRNELRRRAQVNFISSAIDARNTAVNEVNEANAKSSAEAKNNSEAKTPEEIREDEVYAIMHETVEFDNLTADEKKKFNQLWDEYSHSDYDDATIVRLVRVQFAKDRFGRNLYVDESLDNLVQDIKDGQKYSSGEELAREMEQTRLIQEAQTIMKGRSVEETLKSIDKGIENIVQKIDEYQKQINAIQNVEEIEVLQAQVDRLRDSKIELINRREVVKQYREMQEGAENNNNEMAAADGSVDSLDGLPEAAQRKIAQLEAEVAALTNRLADVEKLTTERREGIIKKCFNKLKARGDKLKAKFRGLITRGLAATLGALMLGGGAGVSQLGNGVVNAAGVESVDDGADDLDGEVDVLDGAETQNFVKNRFVGEDSSYVQSMGTSFGQVDLSGGEEAVDKKAEKGSTYEMMPNGLRFNYNAPGGYGSPNKEKPVNYGASVTEKLVNAEQEGKLKEVAIKTIMEMAKNQPEYLAGVASAFPDVYAGIGITEQADSEVAMTQIEKLLETAENGGELQQKLLDGLEGKLKDKDTKFLLEKVNGTELTHYMKPIDPNKANTPDNLAVQSQVKEYHNDDRLIVIDGEGNSYSERTKCRQDQKKLKLKKQGWKVVSRGENGTKVEVVYDVVEDPIVHPDKKDKEDKLKQRKPKRFIATFVDIPQKPKVEKEVPDFEPEGETDIVIDWSDLDPTPRPEPDKGKDPVVENPAVSDPVISNPVVDNPVVDEQQPVVTPEEEDKTEPVNPGGGDETDSEPEPEPKPQPEPEEVLEGKNPEDIDKNAENVENSGQNDSSVVAGETTGDSEIIESNREDKNDEALEGEGSDSAGQAEADEGAQTEDMDESQYDDAAEDFINSMNGNKEQSQTQEDAEIESGASMSEGADEGDSGDAANSVDGSEQSSLYEDMSSKERENYLDSLLQQAQSSAQQAAGGENATETSQVDNLPQADVNTTGTGATTTGGAVNAG